MNTLRHLSMFSVVTPVQRPLQEAFKHSFKDDFPLEILEMDTGGEGNGDFRSPSWFRAVIAKQHQVRTKITQHWGKILIVSDIDIQFFQRVRPEVERLFHDDLDMLFQAETFDPPIINGGFIILRCNERVKGVYDAMLKEDLSQLALPEQTWFNERLGQFPVKWGLLPSTFYAWSHNPFCPPEDIILHHANCTVCANSLHAKLEQIALVHGLVMSKR